jgi:hypothetical protein
MIDDGGNFISGDAWDKAHPERKEKETEVEKKTTPQFTVPEGWRLAHSFAVKSECEVEVYTHDDGRIIVVGDPKSEEHNCDLMGCGQDHVLFVGRPSAACGEGEEEK